MRIELTLLLGTTLVTSAACGGDLLGNEGFEIDCDGRPCDWKVVEGEPERTASWHEGDAGFDMSGEGRVVIEQRTAPFALEQRELVLRAALARGDGASLAFELAWYVAGEGEGPTYWDREPVLVDTRGFTVDQRGVFELEELISTPSLEVSGLALRAVKDGDGTAIVDEVSISDPEVLP
jgi:hypothetical protein